MKSPELVAKAAQLLDGLVQDLDAALAGAPVHGARRRIKRLKSYAILMRPTAGKTAYKEASSHLKSAADALTVLRRSEALGIAVQHLSDKLPDSHALDRLVAEHHAAHVDRTPPEQSLARARRSAATAAAVLASWRLPRAKLPDMSNAFALTYRKTRKLLRHALEGGDATRLHEARKHVIHHMHHMEFLADALPEDPAQRITALNRLREVLGDFNDLVELEHIGAESPDGLSRDVVKVIRTRRKKLLHEARQAWEPLFGKKTKAFVKDIGAIWPQAQT